MKRILTTLVITALMNLWALPSHANFIPPDQSRMEDAPLYMPCRVNYGRGAASDIGFLSCNWLNETIISIYDPEQGQYFKTFTTGGFQCNKSGTCVGTGVSNQGVIIGHHPESHRGLISIWFYLGQSSDGMPVAYRFDQGPYNGLPAVTYLEAANQLASHYERYRADDAFIARKMDQLYQTGIEGLIADNVNAATPTSTHSGKVEGPIRSAWCNPRLDDDCYINEVKVPVADLGKYLKSLNVDVVQNAGGYCEYPVCYDKHDNVIGMREGW